MNEVTFVCAVCVRRGVENGHGESFVVVRLCFSLSMDRIELGVRFL